MPNVARCKHGVILPHECRECEAEIPDAEVKAFATKMMQEAVERAMVEKLTEIIHSCDAGDSNNRPGVTAHDECYVLNRSTCRRIAPQIIAAIRRGEAQGVYAPSSSFTEMHMAAVDLIAGLRAKITELELALEQALGPDKDQEEYCSALGKDRDAALADADVLRAKIDDAVATIGRLGQQAGEAEAECAALKSTVASLVEHAPPGHPLHSCGGPQEACMQPGCTECGCPTMEQALALRKDAFRWRGLIASQRIRPMGCAGLGDDKENDMYAHLGLEIWTVYPGEHDNRIGIDWLTKYADKAASAAGVTDA